MSQGRLNKAAKLIRKYTEAAVALKFMDAMKAPQDSDVYKKAAHRVHCLHGTLIRVVVASPEDL